MAETRIKGQEVVIRLTRQGRFEGQVTAIRDFSLQLDLQTIQQGYLGETSDRFDDVVNGCSGSLTLNAEGPEVFRLIDFIVRRAQRQIAAGEDVVISATFRFNFPDGRRARMAVRDMKFDAIPINAASRQDYVGISLPFKAPVPRLIEG